MAGKQTTPQLVVDFTKSLSQKLHFGQLALSQVHEFFVPYYLESSRDQYCLSEDLQQF
jgi:hypothetical protein